MRSRRICSIFCLFLPPPSFCVWRTSGHFSRCAMTSLVWGTASSLTPLTCLTWGTSGRWVNAQADQFLLCTITCLISPDIDWSLQAPALFKWGPFDMNTLGILKASTTLNWYCLWNFLPPIRFPLLRIYEYLYLCQHPPGTCVGLWSDQRRWGSSVGEYISSHIRTHT